MTKPEHAPFRAGGLEHDGKGRRRAAVLVRRAIREDDAKARLGVIADRGELRF